MGKKWIVELDEKTDEEFRRVIVERKGLHKGVIKEATEEAIRDWIAKESAHYKPTQKGKN